MVCPGGDIHDRHRNTDRRRPGGGGRDPLPEDRAAVAAFFRPLHGIVQRISVQDCYL